MKSIGRMILGEDFGGPGHEDSFGGIVELQISDISLFLH
mgnify:CR=1 FL=1